jgi:hypothetical protein
MTATYGGDGIDFRDHNDRFNLDSALNVLSIVEDQFGVVRSELGRGVAGLFGPNESQQRLLGT